MELSEVSVFEDCDGPDLEIASIECICPKCSARHKIKFYWTGRGVPRKFCNTCKRTVSTVHLISAVPATLLQTVLRID